MQVAVGLRRGGPLLLAGFALVEPFVDHLLEDRRGPDALALLLDDQHVGGFLLDPSPAEHPADLGVARLLGVADHHRALRDGQLGARSRGSAGHHDLVQPGGHQVAAGQALGSTGRRHLHLDVEPVFRAGPGRDRHLHDHHRELWVGQQLAGVLDARLAHLVDELAAIPGRRRVGAGVLQPGHQAHALDLDLASLEHVRKVAHGLLDLRRRRLRSSSSPEARHPPGSVPAPIPRPGLETPRSLRERIATWACLLAHRSGRTPGPVSRTKTRHSIGTA